VGEATEQDEQVEYLVEAPTAPVDEFRFEAVNKSPDRIHDATEDEPEDAGVTDDAMERADEEHR